MMIPADAHIHGVKASNKNEPYYMCIYTYIICILIDNDKHVDEIGMNPIELAPHPASNSSRFWTC